MVTLGPPELGIRSSLSSRTQDNRYGSGMDPVWIQKGQAEKRSGECDFFARVLLPDGHVLLLSSDRRRHSNH